MITTVEEFLYKTIDGVIDTQEYSQQEVYDMFIKINEELGFSTEEEERAKFDSMVEQGMDLDTVIKLFKPVFAKTFEEINVTTMDELSAFFEEAKKI